MDYYLIPEKEVVKELKSDEEHGLTEREARKRLQRYGKNVIKIENRISPLKIFLEQFRSFLVIILLIAALVSYFFGENITDCVLILVIVFFNAFFGFIQDYKAEKSMQALKKMSAKKALVMRDGVLRRINAELIVPGDIVYLEEGELVPADIRLLKANSMEADESILTGESMPSQKAAGTIKTPSSLADRRNMVFMDTIITRGNGYGIAVRTGKETEVGSIAENLSKTKNERTAFEKELQRLGKKIGAIVIILITVIAAIQLALGLNTWSNIFLIAVSLGVAAIPEGLPAVVTLSMALGTKVMLKKNALVRKLTVVEGLGNADVICTDKTGTLTENKMKVTRIWFNKMFIDVKGSSFISGKKYIDAGLLKPLLEIGMNCNDAKTSGNKYIGDPTDVALLEIAERFGIKKLSKDDEIPFSSETKIMVTKHGSKEFMKGAPEEVLKKCSYFYDNGKIRRLNESIKREIMDANTEMAKSALRVLGFAFKEKEFVFVGLQGMMDLPRKGVKEAVKSCLDAGIAIKMITGDNIQTAKAIAGLVGIKGKAIEGSKIEDMSKEELKKIVEETAIFARVAPKHKVMILQALKDNHHNVVMTGDGVNDAPALKMADVGISMGIRGSDMAKSVSDMILLDDNFITIKEAVKEGRTIFINIRKFVNYLLSSNIGEVLTVFFVSLFGFIPLNAVQLLWINLLTDGFPALALGSDPSPKDIMKKKPFKGGIITKKVLKNIITSGIVIGIMATLLFFIGKSKGTTLVFSGLVAYEILRIIMVREGEKFFSNKMLLLAVGFSLMLQLLILYTPLNKFFGVVPLTLLDWGYIAGLGVIGYIVMINVRS